MPQIHASVLHMVCLQRLSQACILQVDASSTEGEAVQRLHDD